MYIGYAFGLVSNLITDRIPNMMAWLLHNFKNLIYIIIGIVGVVFDTIQYLELVILIH